MHQHLTKFARNALRIPITSHVLSLTRCSPGSSSWPRRPIGPQWIGLGFRGEHTTSRDWLARQWLEDKRACAGRDTRRGERRLLGGGWAPFVGSSPERGRAAVDVVEEGNFGGCASLIPSSSEEMKIAPLLDRPDLLITRDIEWANLMFAFEQESRYNIMDPHHPHAPVGSVHEQSNVIYRQLLRTRRPFTAHVIDAFGNDIFKIRRPFWWINSSIYAEVDGKEIGVVHRRWHLWKRIYDLYLGNKQFAVVENPGFWNWTFTLKDEEERVLAEINRDWRGFGFELFTDAGQYVIRFGKSSSVQMHSEAENIEELETYRPLNLSERAVAVALAVSLDCDYFSRHGGWGMPIFVAGE